MKKTRGQKSHATVPLSKNKKTVCKSRMLPTDVTTTRVGRFGLTFPFIYLVIGTLGYFRQNYIFPFLSLISNNFIFYQIASYWLADALIHLKGQCRQKYVLDRHTDRYTG